MTPIRKILVVIDLDLIAAPVLDLASGLALPLGAEVELVHVFETPGYLGPAVVTLGDEGSPALDRWRTARAMVGLLKHLHEKGLEARGRLFIGVAEEKVAELARQEAFDLIVIGSHSREGLDRFVHASVAAALLKTATCPVLVLPHVQDVVA